MAMVLSPSSARKQVGKINTALEKVEALKTELETLCKEAEGSSIWEQLQAVRMDLEYAQKSCDLAFMNMDKLAASLEGLFK